MADTAHVRYVNVLTENAGATLYFGDSRLSAGNASYVPIPADRREFALRQSAEHKADPVAENTHGLRPEAHYTVIAFDDENGKAKIRVLNDEESAPSAGKAKVRIVDVAERLDDFDLYAAGGKKRLAGEPLLGSVSAWRQIDPAQKPLEVRTEDGKVHPIADVHLQSGKLYTFVVADPAKAGGPARVITLENEPSKLPLPLPPQVPPVT